MTTTRDNPGSFRTREARGIRAIGSRFVGLIRRGKFVVAGQTTAVDLINLVENKLDASRAPRFECSCCGFKGHSFRHTFSGGRIVWNSACPRCDSRSRHRGLALLLPTLVTERRPKNILHFAPEQVLRASLSGERGVVYETADLFLENVTHPKVDIQKLPFSDGSYDLVLCNHVLEHVADDKRAICELARVTSEIGACVITVPGDFRRATTITFDGELVNGHYRDYGLDISARLAEVFKHVTTVDLGALAATSGLTRGVRSGELAFVCTNGA